MDKIKIEEETSGRIKVIFPSYNTIYVSKIKKLMVINGIRKGNTGVYQTPMGY